MFKIMTGFIALIAFFIGLVLFMVNSMIRSNAKKQFLKVLESDLEKTTILQYRQIMKQHYSAFLSGVDSTKEAEMQVAGMKRKFKVLAKRLDKTSENSILAAMTQKSKLHRLRFINSLLITLLETGDLKDSPVLEEAGVR